MIRAEFRESNGDLTGFAVSGHSGYAESGRDVVCAAVSSAVQLTVNILDELGFVPDVSAENNRIICVVTAHDDAAFRIIGRLKQHFESILEEFPKTIKITTITEV